MANPAAFEPISVVIPTYGREQVLVDTLEQLLNLAHPAKEILVMDQSLDHEPSTTATLSGLERDGAIRWVRLPEPSIPKAMNQGLLLACQPTVLFLDDDIRPEAALVQAHVSAHATRADVVVAGRVIQPWQENGAAAPAEPFSFASLQPRWIDEFMGGNFSISRQLALTLGGFDENFVRVAYRFEAEFAHRHHLAGGRIFFEPEACIHHLKAPSGGTRTYGEHLTTWRPGHAVGDYYYALRTRAFGNFLARPLRAIATRYHLRRPWRVPATLMAELGGMVWAFGLYLRGPKHLNAPSRDSAS